MRKYIAAGRQVFFLTLLGANALLAQATANTIAFDGITNKFLGISPFAVVAQSSSGLPVSFVSITPTVCKTAGALITLVGVGTCSITASQSGNATYAAAISITRSFTVSLASPSGNFESDAKSPYLVGTNPFAAVVADFNGDGIQDLAVPNATGQNITILLGSHSGGLTAATGSPITLGSNLLFITGGDFNADGNQDLAVGAAGNNGAINIIVLFGNGAGGFTATNGGTFTFGTGICPVVTGDFNGDGIQDLAVASGAGSMYGQVAILLGNGSGGFTQSQGSPFLGGPIPQSIAVGDFNGDGIQDLVTANAGNSMLTVLLGNGSGQFTATKPSVYEGGTFPASLAVGDFNGDGIQDLVLANENENFISVFLGNGSGGFTAAQGSPFTVGAEQVSLVVADFNGDGIPDIATANYAANSVTVLLGNGAGGFAALPGGSFATGAGPNLIVVGDFNGDGIQDLATANYAGNSVTLLLGGQTPGQTPQTIAFGPLNNATFGTAPFTISASATSGLAVAFASSTPSVCSVSSATTTSVDVIAQGVCAITASQQGNTIYQAATSVTQSFTVNSTSVGPTINFDGVVPIFSTGTTIQPGSWISIYGTNLAATATTWNGDFPTQLGGVTVLINGKSAYLLYVSPTQINAQAPDDSTTGNVSVTISNPNGSWTTTVALEQFSPSFSLFDTEHVAGIILRNGSGAYGGGSYDILGPTGTTFGFPHPAVAAKAGDTVVLFGVGFGPTNPTVPAGQLFSGVAITTYPVHLVFGAASVTPSFAGMGSEGLYQFNLTIPAGLGSGEFGLVANVDGVQTQSGPVILSLQ